MSSKQKLELDWIGKQNRPSIEPRILLEEAEHHYHATHRISENDIFDNVLIQGDNLLALKALEQDYLAKVKCVFIDPPYNTGSAFTHYDDGIEHSIWLGLMRDRLEILHKLLAEDGSLWITIDDAEGHYLKVLCDEVFGRPNFVATVTWQKTTSIHNNATYFSSATDFILVYAKSIDSFKIGRIPRSDRNLSDYSNPDNDPRGAWASSPLHVSLTSGQRGKQFAKTGTSTGLFALKNPHGEDIFPPKGRCWAYSQDTINALQSEGLIWWGKDGRNQPRLKRFIRESKEGIVPSTLWLSEEVGHNQEAKAENQALIREEDMFSTPKPERLLARILELSTKPGDLVLDSFAGSGTTGAVAHKMGRKWIMVELGSHCHTHIIPRLRQVIDGSDQNKVSIELGWQGGGGFKFYRLAPTLLEKDKWSNLVINPQYNPIMLAKAMCKHMGFTYRPDENHYFIHGHSSESDFIYVTTACLTYDQIKAISEELGASRSLLICCKAFKAQTDSLTNITVTKIPNSLLRRCEWGRDDYSLNINNLQPLSDEVLETGTAKQPSLTLSGEGNLR